MINTKNKKNKENHDLMYYDQTLKNKEKLGRGDLALMVPKGRTTILKSTKYLASTDSRK